MDTFYHQQQVDAKWIHGPHYDNIFHGLMLVGQEETLRN